jgi:F-type H+-transporting ATPase subunit delta
VAGKTGNQDIAKRYALAFFALAKEQGKIDLIAADLSALQGILAQSADFTKFTVNPSLRRQAQADVLAAIGDKAQFDLLSKNFLGTLALKRRLAILPHIISAVQAEIALHKGEITAEVTAAETLTAQQIDAIAAALKKSLGKTVQVQVKLDASLIGGLVVKVGSQLIDSSVKTKLARLHRALTSSTLSSDKSKMREVA